MSALRGRSLGVCAALPGSGGMHKCPAAALFLLSRRALLLQEVAGTHSGCKAANEIFSWRAESCSDPPRAHVAPFHQFCCLQETTHLQAGLAEMKHIKEWVCEPGAEVCSEGCSRTVSWERRGCRGVREDAAGGWCGLRLCLRRAASFLCCPRRCSRLRWLFCRDLLILSSKSPPCQRSTL